MPQLHLPPWQLRHRWHPSGQQGGGRHIAGIRAQGDGFNDIGRASDASADDQGNLIPDAFIPQALVYSGQSQFDGDAHVIPDAGGRGARAAPEAVDSDDVRPASGDTAGDSGDVVDGGYLDDHRFFYIRSLPSVSKQADANLQ